jgi:serine/threonine-protein kinase HipA
MRKAKVFVKGKEAGILTEMVAGKRYRFQYLQGYKDYPVSLTMPVNQQQWDFDAFPPFFDGLLPEGMQLDGLLKIRKLDRNDYFSQLMVVGEDMVGAVMVKEIFE